MYVPGITELVILSAEVIQCALDGDIETSRKRLDRLRVLRSRTMSNLKTTQDFRSSNSYEDLLSEDLVRMKLEPLELEKNMLYIRDWLRSSMDSLSVDELFLSDEGVNLYLDVFLPESWDFSHDILMLNITDASTLIPRLKRRGQLSYLILEGSKDSLSDADILNNLRLNYPSLRIVSWDPLDPIESTNIKALMLEAAPPVTCYLDPFDRRGDSDSADRALAFLAHLSVKPNSSSKWPILFTETWLSQLAELSRFRSVMSLQSVFQDSAVLIASSGPSLSDSLPDLALLREKYLVLAPIRSLQTLFDFGIDPDFAIHVDGTDFSKIMPVDEKIKQVPLICIEQAHKSVWGANFKEVFVAPLNNYLDSPISLVFHGPKAVSGVGSGVSTALADMSIRLGASSITLIGQDLSTSLGTYASSAKVDPPISYYDDRGGSLVSSGQLTCEGINGELLTTMPDYKLFIEEFEALVGRYSSSVKLINATKHGAFLKGWRHCGLSDDSVQQFARQKVSSQESDELDTSTRQFCDRVTDLMGAVKLERYSTEVASNICRAIIAELRRVLSINDNDVTMLEGLEKQMSDASSMLFKCYSYTATARLNSTLSSVESLQDNFEVCLDYYLHLSNLTSQLDEALSCTVDDLSKLLEQ